jgi:hypothetical protein
MTNLLLLLEKPIEFWEKLVQFECKIANKRNKKHIISQKDIPVIIQAIDKS